MEIIKTFCFQEVEESQEYHLIPPSIITMAVWSESTLATEENNYCKENNITNPGEMGLRIVPRTFSEKVTTLGVKVAKTTVEIQKIYEENQNTYIFKEDDLLIPAYNIIGELQTIQSVNLFSKTFMKSGYKKGIFTIAGINPDKKILKELFQDKDIPLIIATDYATAHTVSKLIYHPIIVTFEGDNLNAVIKNLREIFPKHSLIITADNDILNIANTVAEKYGTGLAIPQPQYKNWNDLCKLCGDYATRKILEEQIAIAKRDAAILADRILSRDIKLRNNPTPLSDYFKITLEYSYAAIMIASAIYNNTQNLTPAIKK